MKPCKVGLIAAMPEEVAPLLKKIGGYKKVTSGRHDIFSFNFNGQDTKLLTSGMGPANAASAARTLIDSFRPELIVNFGFAGSLSPELNVGDIVTANRILFLHDRLFSEQQGLGGEIFVAGVKTGAFVTTGKVTDKKWLSAKLPNGISKAVVEMETAAVAQAAHREGIPLIAIRAISDGFDEELGFSLDEFCDRELNLQKWRVLLTVAKKPWIIPQLMRLSRNSGIASNALAEAVCVLLAAIIRQ